MFDDMTERFKISKLPGERTKYYIQDTYLLFSCSVDSFDVSDSVQLEKAREMQYRVGSGELIGVRIPGYAIFVQPSKNAYKSEHVKVTKNLLPSIQEMASLFLETIIKPSSYLFYASRVADESLLEPSPVQKKRLEDTYSGPHFITVPHPDKTYIDGLVFEVKLSWISQYTSFYTGISAENENGRLVSASIRLFENTSVVRRRHCKRLVKDALSGDKIIAKVEGYQILLIARSWNKSLLTQEDVKVLLNQMASYFLTEEVGQNPEGFKFYLDVSDEEFDRRLANKEIRDDTYKRSLFFAGITLGVAILVFLGMKGWLLGGFGLIMLLAYADDMFARR